MEEGERSAAMLEGKIGMYHLCKEVSLGPHQRDPITGSLETELLQVLLDNNC